MNGSGAAHASTRLDTTGKPYSPLPPPLPHDSPGCALPPYHAQSVRQGLTFVFCDVSGELLARPPHLVDLGGLKLLAHPVDWRASEKIRQHAPIGCRAVEGVNACWGLPVANDTVDHVEVHGDVSEVLEDAGRLL